MEENVRPNKVYSTDNLDLAAFLMLHDVPFLGCRVIIDRRKDKPKATMDFDNSKQNILDLERIFVTSTEKRYRDLTKYLLKEVHRSVRSYTNDILKPRED